MPCVGFILRPQKRPRVLTHTLQQAAAERGLSLLALDPDSTPEQWQAAGVDVLVHKAPDEAGLDERLAAWAAAGAAASTADTGGGACGRQRLLLDAPEAVRRLQDRQEMLAPLQTAAGDSPLLLTRPQEQDANKQQPSSTSPQSASVVAVSTPQQVVLQPGCSLEQALQQLNAAGMQLPVLVKPLVSATTDSFRPVPPAAVGGVGNGGGSCGSAAAGGGVKDGVESPAASNSSSCAAGSCGSASNDGHTLGAIWTEAGLQALLSAGATSTHQRPVLQSQTQQQQQQQEQQQPPQKQEQPQLQLPVVLQQYVPHEALYKLYVIGPSCVLTRRSTITPAVLEAAAAAAPTGKQGVVILPRLSADKWAAVQQAQQQAQLVSGSSIKSSGSSGSGGFGAAVADVSVEGDTLAPPLWAMQQLAAHLRKALGLNLFNVDIIVSSSSVSGSGASGGSNSNSSTSVLVVDINFFPGYDKIAGAEVLFADFLADLCSERSSGSGGEAA